MTRTRIKPVPRPKSATTGIQNKPKEAVLDPI